MGAGGTLYQEIVILFRVPQRQVEVGFPGLRQAVQEGEEVVGAEHVAGGGPELRVATGQHERHIAAVGAAHDGGAGGIHARVLAQVL